jgi:hypothetical protein
VIVTGDLSDDRGDLLVEREVAVLDKESPNAAEVDRGEEVLEVEIQNPAASPVLACIRDDRLVFLESVRGPVFQAPGLFDLELAILKEIGQFSLEILQLVDWCLDCSLPA